MADNKIGVWVPKETHDAVKVVQEMIHKELGFKPSIPDCVGYLAKFWKEHSPSHRKHEDVD
jgi:hypothetical protein